MDALFVDRLGRKFRPIAGFIDRWLSRVSINLKIPLAQRRSYREIISFSAAMQDHPTATTMRPKYFSFPISRSHLVSHPSYSINQGHLSTQIGGIRAFS